MLVVAQRATGKIFRSSFLLQSSTDQALVAALSLVRCMLTRGICATH